MAKPHWHLANGDKLQTQAFSFLANCYKLQIPFLISTKCVILNLCEEIEYCNIAQDQIVVLNYHQTYKWNV